MMFSTISYLQGLPRAKDSETVLTPAIRETNSLPDHTDLLNSSRSTWTRDDFMNCCCFCRQDSFRGKVKHQLCLKQRPARSARSAPSSRVRPFECCHDRPVVRMDLLQVVHIPKGNRQGAMLQLGRHKNVIR